MSENVLVAIVYAGATVVAAFVSTRGVKAPGGISLTRSRRMVRWFSLALLILGAALVGFVIHSLTNNQKIDIFLETLPKFDFENITDPIDTQSWTYDTYPVQATAPLVVSNQRAHSGSNSLRLSVKVQPLTNNQPKEYGGVALSRTNSRLLRDNKIIAATAWVFIPSLNNGQSQNINFSAHMSAFTNNKEGQYLGIFGEDVPINPGEWTPVSWYGTYQISSSLISSNLGGFVSNDHRMYEFHVSAWIDKGEYDGFIYIDDVTFYKEKE